MFRIKEILNNTVTEEGKRATVVWLADKIGLAQPNTNNIVNNKAKPSWDNLIKIAEVLKVPIRDLFASDGTSGYIEHNGIVHKITSVKDIKDLLNKIESYSSNHLHINDLDDGEYLTFEGKLCVISANDRIKNINIIGNTRAYELNYSTLIGLQPIKLNKEILEMCGFRINTVAPEVAIKDNFQINYYENGSFTVQKEFTADPPYYGLHWLQKRYKHHTKKPLLINADELVKLLEETKAKKF